MQLLYCNFGNTVWTITGNIWGDYLVDPGLREALTETASCGFRPVSSPCSFHRWMPHSRYSVPICYIFHHEVSSFAHSGA